MDTDRNILFGVLALRAGLVDTEQLAAVCDRWAQQKKLTLPDLLLQANGLNGEDRVHVEYLLDRQLTRHGNSPKAALAALADAHVRSALGGVRDTELRDWLAEALPGGLYLEPGARTGRGWRTWAIVGAVIALFLMLGGGAGVFFIGYMASRERVMGEIAAHRAALEARLEAEQAMAVSRQDREALDRALRAVAGNGDEPQSLQVREKFLQELLAAHQERLSGAPSDNHLRSVVADAQEQLAEHYVKVRNVPQALELLRQAIQLHEELSSQQRSQSRHRRDLGRCQTRLGTLLREAGKLTEARQLLHQAIANLRNYYPDTPGGASQIGRQQAAAHLELARVERSLGNLKDAETACDQAVNHLETLTSQEPRNVAYRRELVEALRMRAELQRADGRLAEAESTLRQAIQHLEPLVADQPKEAAATAELARAYETLAEVLRAAGKEKEAAAVLQKLQKVSAKQE